MREATNFATKFPHAAFFMGEERWRHSQFSAKILIFYCFAVWFGQQVHISAFFMWLHLFSN